MKTQLVAEIIRCVCWIFAISGDFQIGLGCFLLLPKLEGPEIFVHNCSSQKNWRILARIDLKLGPQMYFSAKSQSEWAIRLVPEPHKMAIIIARRWRGTWEGVPIRKKPPPPGGFPIYYVPLSRTVSKRTPLEKIVPGSSRGFLLLTVLNEET